ncbi:hypothetical protein RJ55_02947 [Drechmeria coniospora]|nr:hypothetical protein RJ55_02947 [Drechmeria coniospora]
MYSTAASCGVDAAEETERAAVRDAAAIVVSAAGGGEVVTATAARRGETRRGVARVGVAHGESKAQRLRQASDREEGRCRVEPERSKLLAVEASQDDGEDDGEDDDNDVDDDDDG